MRRWIAALLALQFLCSMSLGLVGPVPDPAAPRDGSPAIAVLLSGAGADAAAVSPSVLDTEHDLLDEKPDLPDGIDRQPPAAAPITAWSARIARDERQPASPTPPGLQRPPQA